MSKCPKCEGSGTLHKHQHCYHSPYDTYINDCYKERVCDKCRGTGSTGAKLIEALLLEIKLESKDYNSRKLAEKALGELEK